jgi:predicted dehydrogenase
MDDVRIGIVGLGNMGKAHANYLAKGKIKGAALKAVVSINAKDLEWAEQNLGKHIQTFKQEDDLYRSGAVDAVLIATPHYHHPQAAIKAFNNGMHVLIEKPAGVYTKQVREMNETARKSGKVFSIMYNQRTNPLYQKLRDLIQAGELGEIRRMNWIITNWYRSQSYYDSGGWREALENLKKLTEERKS